jgi:cell division septum initiation protein DivIVA
MDILNLVDRLEELFNESRPIPLTNNVVVDEDRMLDLIDQMRVAIPEEVKKSQKLLAERDRTLAQAQEEAKRTIQLARDKSEGLVERDSIVAASESRADQILEQAQLDAEATRKEADDYVLESLTSLEMEMERLLNQVRNGIRSIMQQQEAPASPIESAKEATQAAE